MLSDRLQRARKAAGLSLRDLATAAGISHTAVAKFENGGLVPDSAMLLKLARATGVRVEYFLRSEAPPLLENVEYRKRAKLGVRALERIQARVLDHVERYAEVLELFPEPPIEPFRIPEELPKIVSAYDDVEDIAEAVRDARELGRDPISDLTDLLEEMGVLVLVDAGEDERFDGLAATVGHHHLIVVGATWPADRQRFTLAHELGHLVLAGRLADSLDEEKACNRFAGAFLAPRTAVFASIGAKRSRVDPAELYRLKREFGLSMGAWIARLRDLGVLPEQRATSMYKLFSIKGWRKREPGDALAPEAPRRFELLVLRALAEDFIGESKAAELLGISQHDLRKQRFLEEGAGAAAGK